MSTLVAMADMVVTREEEDGARTELVIRIPEGVWNDPLPGQRVRVIDVRYVPPQRETSD